MYWYYELNTLQLKKTTSHHMCCRNSQHSGQVSGDTNETDHAVTVVVFENKMSVFVA